MVYPIYQIDIFSFDWKVPVTSVQMMSNTITSYARIPNLPSNVVLQMPLSQWFPLWFRQQFFDNKLLLVGVILGTLVWGLYFLFKDRERFRSISFYITLTSITGTLFWFFSAPNFRFGYGFLIPSFLLLCAPLLMCFVEKSNNRIKDLLHPAFTFILAVIIAMNFLKAPYHLRQEYIYPAEYPVAKVKSVPIDNLFVFEAVNSQLCWYRTFPCIPRRDALPDVNSMSDNIHLRGTTFREGFYITNAP